mmetsp:Transcript_75345/g.201903  ORF Transcript_75345/g.201903 Transcript_75345/m.201903 type:complete len:131 (+) Transcript_75345:141-533(+)
MIPQQQLPSAHSKARKIIRELFWATNTMSMLLRLLLTVRTSSNIHWTQEKHSNKLASKQKCSKSISREIEFKYGWIENDQRRSALDFWHGPDRDGLSKTHRVIILTRSPKYVVYSMVCAPEHQTANALVG